MSKNKMTRSLCISLLLLSSAFAPSTFAADVETVGDLKVDGEIWSTSGGFKSSGTLTVAGATNLAAPAQVSGDLSSGHILTITNTNASNNYDALNVTTSGGGSAIYASSSGGSGIQAASNYSAGAGLVGDNSAGGEGVLGRTTSTGNATGAVVGRNDGAGYGVYGFVATNTSGTGIGVLGLVGSSSSTGRAGRFENVNSANASNTLEVYTNGTGNAFVSNHSGSTGNLAVFKSSGLNRARIDKTGKGFFNGGTQNSGADLAELFDVEGSPSQYEPGDVLEISVTADRAVTRSTKPYSALVAGVYATKSGVLLTEDSIDADLSAKVPMGVIGVIPTKVCNENGPIQRGDLLVTSGKAGHAMKADLARVKPGQVIGKALETFYGEDTGKIRVLVNVR